MKMIKMTFMMTMMLIMTILIRITNPLDQEYGEEEVFIVIKEAKTEEEAVALLRFYNHHYLVYIL